MLEPKLEKFVEACGLCATASDDGGTTIYVKTNSKIDIIYSAIKDLKEKTIRNKGDEDSIKFYNFNFQRKEAKIKWSSYITLEHMYSSFFLTKYTTEEHGDKYNIYYYGEYTHTSFQRFLAALSRYQVLLNTQITVSFLNINDRMDSGNTLNRFFGKTNEIYDIEIGKIKLVSDQPDFRKLQFTIVGS